MLANIANVASVVSAIVGVITLPSITYWMYKLVFKQENNSSFIVNGDIKGDVISGGVLGRSKPNKPISSK